MNSRRVLSILLFLLIILIVFGTAPTASAKLKATATFYIWEKDHLHFSHSIANLRLDGKETNIVHELDFDKDFYDPTVQGSTTKAMCDKVAALSDPEHPQHSQWRENCPEARNTSFAGVMELGVPYQKIEDSGTAYVFDFTKEWSLIDCDLNGDMSWDNTDLNENTVSENPGLLPNWDTVQMPTNGTTFPSDKDQSYYFKVLAIDVVNDCSTGNCTKELVTTIFIDLDINKDNQITAAEDGVPIDATGNMTSGCVCFYAKAIPISWPTTPSSALWVGNPQSRITAGGGDKTVNFNLLGPTVISLDKLAAYSPGGISPAIWLAIFTTLTGIAYILIRESKKLPQTRRK